MNKKKLFTSLYVLVIALVLAACGQLSVGIAEPAAGSPTGGEVVPTEVPATPETVETPVPTMEPEPEQELHAIPTLVFIGTDGNLWVLDAGSETPRQLTTDASPFGGTGTAVSYDSPALSSDGNLLAFRKDIGTPSQGDGYDVTGGLYVLDLRNAEQTQVLEGYAAGWDWKPETHVLAYGIAVETEYFLGRGEPDPDLANGIYTIDFDSEDTEQLVAPERGLTLAGPQWSPDGRFLGFSEVQHMEGSGNFAYFDLTTGEYYSWEEPVGPFSWSPNGGLVAYSRQTYTATGEERLYIRERGDVEEPIGPDYDGPAYATQPVFSPDGSRIAYLAFLEGPETNTAVVTVLDLATGQTETFSTIEEPWYLTWTPDGSHLVFSTGTWGSRQIVALELSDGSETVLGEGSQPALAGR